MCKTNKQTIYIYIYINIHFHVHFHSWLPVYYNNDKKFSVMSIAFLLPNQDDSVVWRGPKKNCMDGKIDIDLQLILK